VRIGGRVRISIDEIERCQETSHPKALVPRRPQ
jgi:hypothetical protein